MLSWKAIRAFHVKGPIDKEYVREFVKWRDENSALDDHLQVERFARHLAIEEAGLGAYLKELTRPQVESYRADLRQRYDEWWSSEDYAWLRGYLLENTNGTAEEIEELIRPDFRVMLNSGNLSRERRANWLWNTRHHFGVTHDLETVLELGALTRQVQAEMKEDDSQK